MPPILGGGGGRGGHIVSLVSVCPVCLSVPYKKVSLSLSFEKISVLDS